MVFSFYQPRSESTPKNRNMDYKVLRQSILTCGLVILSLEGYQTTERKWSVEIPSRVLAWTGSCAVIPCTYSVTDLRVDVAIDYYIWYQNPVYSDPEKTWNGKLVYHSVGSTVVDPSFNDRVIHLGVSAKNCTVLLKDLQKEHAGNFSVILWKDEAKWMQTPFMNLEISDSAPDPKIEPMTAIRELQEAKMTCSIDYYCPHYQVNLTWIGAGVKNGTSETIIQKVTTGFKIMSTLTFYPSWEDHNQTLECVLTEGIEQKQTAENRIVLNVEYAPKHVQILSKPSNLTIKAGQQIILECTAKSSNPAINKYTWYKGDKPLQYDKIMEIKAVADGNSGTYICVAENDVDKTLSDPVTITVLYAPIDIIITKRKGNIKEGDKLALKCSARANPQVTHYAWYKDKERCWNQTSEEYTITNIQEYESGSYECEAYSPLGSSKSQPAVVDVMYLPKYPEVITEKEGDRFIEGNKVKLKCAVNSSNPQVSKTEWYKNKKSIAINKDYIYFESINAADSGEYMCKAINTIGGTSSQSIPIKVLYPPKEANVEVVYDKYIEEGQRILLRCRARQSEPIITGYKWYKDQSPYSRQGAEVTFESITWTDTGHYSCEAWNDINSVKSKDVYVDVQYAPQNVTVFMKPSSWVTENTDVELTCTTKANPDLLEYRWYRSNTNVKQNTKYVRLDNIKRSEAGEYYCTAQNRVGTKKSDIAQLYVSYSSTTIVKYAAGAGGVCILLIIIIFLVLRFKVWQKIHRQPADDRSDTSFFVVKKSNHETSDNMARQTPPSCNSGDELSYSTIQFVAVTEEETVMPRTSVKFQDTAVVYSVVTRKPFNAPQAHDYENIQAEKGHGFHDECQEEIHYSTIANLSKEHKVHESDNEVQYAMLKH
ncbi:B-cell receptor CD22-like isoform X2 [Ascaphus truei]|uniref:B-cell receptor CD22-like isoform X2 n=1 Tax=Ascaphus truei TaxID=8439 RepID=UPI003F5A28EC